MDLLDYNSGSDVQGASDQEIHKKAHSDGRWVWLWAWVTGGSWHHTWAVGAPHRKLGLQGKGRRLCQILDVWNLMSQWGTHWLEDPGRVRGHSLENGKWGHECEWLLEKSAKKICLLIHLLHGRGVHIPLIDSTWTSKNIWWLRRKQRSLECNLIGCTEWSPLGKVFRALFQLISTTKLVSSRRPHTNLGFGNNRGQL